MKNKFTDAIIIMLIVLCTTSAVNQAVRVRTRRAGTSRITPRFSQRNLIH